MPMRHHVVHGTHDDLGRWTRNPADFRVVRMTSPASGQPGNYTWERWISLEGRRPPTLHSL